MVFMSVKTPVTPMKLCHHVDEGSITQRKVIILCIILSNNNVVARYVKLRYDNEGVKLLKSVRKSHKDCMKFNVIK